MKVGIKEPEQELYFKEIDGSLQSLQSIVEGYIEYINFDKYCMIVNEEGKYIDHLKPNFYIPAIGDVMIGTVIFAENNGSDIAGISDEEHFLEAYNNLFLG